MKEWFKAALKDDNNKRGLFSVIITIVVCFLIGTMFGFNMFWPSIGTGWFWLATAILSFVMFMGFSGRESD